MPTLKLPTVLAQANQSYHAQMNGQVRLGEVARYLAQFESRIESTALEIARPVQVNQRLRDVDIRPGDRLVAFSALPRTVELPAPLHSGDKILKFRIGDFEMSSRGKKSLLVGKADESQAIPPDIDLRHFLPARSLEYISRQCLTLTFDDMRRTWSAQKTGQTRITLDELEFGTNPVVLNAEQSLRFYRANDDLATATPLSEIRLMVEPVMGTDLLPTLPQGATPVKMRVGLEKQTQLLHASDNIRLGQIVSSLALHHQTALHVEWQAYVLRLASPEARIGTLGLGDEEFLYTAFSLRHTHNALLLRDVYDHNRTYILTTRQGDETHLIGCRSTAESQSGDLDVDLYDTVTAHGNDPRPFAGFSPYFASIQYQAASRSWSIQFDQRAHLPLFVNHQRATSRTALPLTSGDVLSFGPSVEHVYARLVVEITRQA